MCLLLYLWARTIISEAPDDGTGIPVEVPLMRSLWLVKKKGRNKALRWVRDKQNRVQTETVNVTYANGTTRTVRRPLLEIFEPESPKDVENGTVTRGAATCPITGYTTPASNVRNQFKGRCGGGDDARLFCVVLVRSEQQGRFYRIPTAKDLDIVNLAQTELARREKQHQGLLSLVPDEELPYLRSIFNIHLLDVTDWGSLFTARQLLLLTTLARLVQEVGAKLLNEHNNTLALAVNTCLSIVLDRQANTLTSISRWNITGEKIEGVFARQAMGIVWDFTEANPFSNSTGCFDGALQWVTHVCETNASLLNSGQAENCSATDHLLPNQSAQLFCTDPPYYDSVPYADLSDFFYVWLKRSIGKHYKSLF